jgi:hypothetical protein
MHRRLAPAPFQRFHLRISSHSRWKRWWRAWQRSPAALTETEIERLRDDMAALGLLRWLGGN